MLPCRLTSALPWTVITIPFISFLLFFFFHTHTQSLSHSLSLSLSLFLYPCKNRAYINCVNLHKLQPNCEGQAIVDYRKVEKKLEHKTCNFKIVKDKTPQNASQRRSPVERNWKLAEMRDTSPKASSSKPDSVKQVNPAKHTKRKYIPR